MNELGRLLEVIHNSRESWRTLRAEYRIWTHSERSAAAWEAAAEREGSTTYAALASEGELEPDESDGVWRIWVAKPDRMRQETEGRALGGPRTTITVGKRWWSWDEHSGAQTNEGSEEITTGGAQYSAWLEPAQVLAALHFEPLGETVRAGRAALRAMARMPPVLALEEDELSWALHRLGGSGADEYELEVDAELGILLRVEARFQGEPHLIGEILELGFDEDFGTATFVLEPPAGEEIRSVADRFGRALDRTIDEAAAESPFPVLILPSVPDDWHVSVSSFPPGDRPPTPHCVHVDYGIEDGTARVSISQVPAGKSDFDVLLHDADPPFEEVERDGLTMLVRGRSGEWPQTQVHLTQGETELTLTSDELSGEKLVELAARLVPARTAPPEI